MIVLNESFSLIKEKESIFDCTGYIECVQSKYTFFVNDTQIAELHSDNQPLICRFAIAELNNILVNFIDTIDNTNLEVIFAPSNKFFKTKIIRCQHIRTKGVLKGNICNKLIFNSFSPNRLGGRIFCPRCRNFSYI